MKKGLIATTLSVAVAGLAMGATANADEGSAGKAVSGKAGCGGKAGG